MEIPLLNELLVIFVLALIVFIVAHRFHVPPVVGFLITGMLAGPHGFSLISSEHEIELLAELGVVLLLFTVGLEFSLHTLLSMRRFVVIGGTVQLLLTIGTTFIASSAAGIPMKEALFCGFLVSLSSTAVVLKLLQDRGEIDSLQGRVAFAVLLAQDLAVVPLSLGVPMLSDKVAGGIDSAMARLADGTIVLVASVATAIWAVPRLLHLVARTRSREVFLLTLIVILFSVAFLTQKAGLSLALGALLAGLLISESEYGHQALANVLPFQQIFTTLFFVSVGMLLDVSHAASNIVLIGGITLGLVVGKTIIMTLVSSLLGFSLRVGVLSGLALWQIGEFSFVLARAGSVAGILVGPRYQTFLAVSVASIILTPATMAIAPFVARLLERLPLPRSIVLGRFHEVGGVDAQEKFENHLIVVGYGIAGRLSASAAEKAGIQHVVLELNPDTVRAERAAGHPLRFGDATQEEVLKGVGVEAALAVVLAVPDPVSTERVITLVRSLNPRAHIIARTKFQNDRKMLLELGAHAVVTDEYEAALQLAREVMTSFGVARDQANAIVEHTGAVIVETDSELE